MRIPIYEVPVDDLETILVADDSDTVRRYICAVLRTRGYRVLEAASATEAGLASQMHAERIDLLIADVELPDAKGQNLAKQLRATWPALAVLYISGYCEEILGEGALGPGTGFLQKPFTSDALLRQVRQALRKQARNRILVVDDEPLVTRYVGEALADAGFEVLVADNGKRAMSTLIDHSVELVITDLVMPEMEGLEVIMALRKSRPLLPIVAISGFDRYLEVAIKLGAQAALRKPFSIPQLLEAVQQALRSGGSG